MENQTVFTQIPSINLQCVKHESDSDLEVSLERSNHSTQSRIRSENHHRKFLKLACKTEKGLEWVTASTTATGLTIGLVVAGNNHEVEEELVDSNAESGISDDLLNQNECEWFGSSVGENGPAMTRKSVIQAENQGDELFQFLFTMPTAPLNGVFRLKEWYMGKYKYVDKNSSIVKTVVDIIKLKYCELSIEEIYDHIMTCDQMYYAATFGNFPEYYYSIQESIDELENVLLHQFDHDKELIKSFLKNLYDVLNKNLPKINTFFVHGREDKSFFFDAVVHYCVNFGQVGNFNAFSRFPFQDCVNRRVLLWNDPNVERSAWTTLQLLFGGDAINVKVNDRDDYTVIGRTPIIILADQNMLPKHQAYNNRFTYQWDRCYSSLKDLKKKPLPIAIYHLFKKYNII